MTETVRYVEVAVDVTAATGWSSPLHTAALVAIPATVAKSAPVMFAFPGGTHAKEYYHMQIDGRVGYSMAEYCARRGFVFVAADPLGVGGSSSPTPDERATRQTFVDANSATVQGVVSLLREGRLADDIRPVESSVTLGMGTSMGAMLLVEQQASHRDFDGIVVMGYSTIHTRLATPPEGWQQPPEFRAHSGSGETGARDLFYTLYWDDTPADVVAADQAASVPPPMAAVRAGGGFKDAMAPGAIAEAASAVDVPVLVALGERDTCPDPHAEVAGYPRSNDVSLYIVPRAGHAPSVANTRKLLWDRIIAWATRVGAQR